MDPDFMTRYLPQQGAEREAGQGQGEPVGEPDVGEAPSIGESPSVGQAGAHIEGAEREERTAVGPPDAVAQGRSGPAPSGPAPEGGPAPQAPPDPGERAGTEWGGNAAPSETERTSRQGQYVAGEPAAPEGTGAHSHLDGGWKAAPDPERTTPVEQAARPARSAPEPPILETRPTERGTARRKELGPEAEQAAPPGQGYGEPRIPPPSPRLPGGYQGGHPNGVPAAGRPGGPVAPSGASIGPQPRVAADPPTGHGGPAWRPAEASPPSGAGWNPNAAPPAHFRPDELTKSRTLPPEMGWRKAVYVGTGHLINLGAGPAERTLRDQIALIGSNIPGNYSIAFVSIKGGVGKTRTTAGVGTVYATYRTEPVLALDANPTYGSLGRVIDPSATASIREYMADEQVQTYPRARSYTGKNKPGLEVLAGNQNVANPLALSDQLFTDTLGSVQRFYQLSLIDCGNHIEHRVMKGVFGSVDALVILGTMNYDGAEAAEKTLQWLAVRNMQDLLDRSILVLNDVNRCYNKAFVTKVHERLKPRVGAVTTIPFDRHLRDGAELDFGALRRRTQLAYMEIAAWLAQGFATARAGAR